MISFREHSFEKINQENFCMRSNDYRKFNPNFAILSSSVYAKPELREEIAEKEVRDAYLYAAEILVEKHHY